MKITVRAKMLLGVLVLGLFAVSNMEMARAAVYDIPFTFRLQAGGDKDKSLTVEKTNMLDHACIYFETYENKSAFDAWFRLRSGTNNTAASALYSLIDTGFEFPTYNSGYGKISNRYYFNMQTDSASLLPTKATGSWAP